MIALVVEVILLSTLVILKWNIGVVLAIAIGLPVFIALSRSKSKLPHHKLAVVGKDEPTPLRSLPESRPRRQIRKTSDQTQWTVGHAAPGFACLRLTRRDCFLAHLVPEAPACGPPVYPQLQNFQVGADGRFELRESGLDDGSGRPLDQQS